MPNPTRSAPERAELPTKTKLVSALFAISGVLSLPMGLLLLSASSSYAAAGASDWAELSTTLAVVTFLLAGVSLALAYGLWKVRTWGWYGAAAFVSLGIIFGIWSVLRGGSLPWYTLGVGLATLWVLWDDQWAFGLQYELPV